MRKKLVAPITASLLTAAMVSLFSACGESNPPTPPAQAEAPKQEDQVAPSTGTPQLDGVLPPQEKAEEVPEETPKESLWSATCYSGKEIVLSVKNLKDDDWQFSSGVLVIRQGDKNIQTSAECVVEPQQQ